jgi:hypothetical protein
LTVTGNGTSSSLVVSGTLPTLNSDLASLTYTPNSGYSGPDMLSLSDEDTSDALNGTANVSITVNSLLAPTITVPSSVSVDENGGVVLFKMDGAGSAVVLYQNGDLVRYKPGSETPKLLDNTVTTTATDGTTVTSSVATFGVDGSGSVVVLESTVTQTTTNGTTTTNSVGNLYLYAPGSNTAETLDTNVSKFVIDGAGSVVALEAAGSSSVNLANGQVFSTPIYNLVRFAPDSTEKQTMDTGTTQMVLDGDGSVVALDNFSTSQVTLANGQPYITPSYTMVRFAPGSTVKEAMDAGVTQMALDGAGSIVALDSLTTTPPVTLDNGQLSNSPAYSLVSFAPGPTPGFYERQLMALSVTQIVVDGSGSVVALESPSNETLTGSNGQVDNEVVYNLVRFAPGSTTPQQPAMDTGVSTIVVDGSGSIIAMDSLSLGTTGPVGQLSLFAPGSDTPQPMAPMSNVHGSPAPVSSFFGSPVSSFALDGSGSVVALIPPSIGDTYTLVRFAPGSTSPQQLDTDVSSFVIDGSGSVVALKGGALERFEPGSNTPQPMTTAGAVSSYVLDGSGSVNAVSNGELWFFAPGSDTGKDIATLGQYLVPFQGSTYQIALDGTGAVVTQVNGTLARFERGLSLPITTYGSISSFVVDGTGSVYAIENYGELYFYAPGSTTGQEITAPNSFPLGFVNIVVDASGSVLALGNNDSLWRIAPGTTTATLELGSYDNLPGVNLLQNIPGGSQLFAEYILAGSQFLPGNPQITQIAVDGCGDPIALVHEGNDTYLVRFAPGLSSVTQMQDTTGVTNFFIDNGGVLAEVPDSSSTGTSLVSFAPGATQGVTISDVSSWVVDGSGNVFVLYDGQSTTPPSSGDGALPIVCSLVILTAGGAQSTPVDIDGNPMDNISNITVDSTGSVVALDGSTLYRFAPGSTSAVSINYFFNGQPATVTAFVVDGAGNLVTYVDSPFAGGRVTNGFTNQALISYAPGSSTGTEIDFDVVSFGLSGGNVYALDEQAGVGELVTFLGGIRTPLDKNSVYDMQVIDNTGDILAFENVSSGAGTLVLISGNGTANPPIQRLDAYQVLAPPNPGTSNPFFLDSGGIIIAIDIEPVNTRSIQSSSGRGLPGDCLVAITFPNGLNAPSKVVPLVLLVSEVQVLPDLTVLALSGNSMYAYQSGQPVLGLLPAFVTVTSGTVNSFAVPASVGTYKAWEVANDAATDANGNSDALLNITSPPSIWHQIVGGVEVFGALFVTFLTDGAASPLIGLAVDVGEQAINDALFGTSFNFTDIFTGALGGAIGAAGDLTNMLEDLGGLPGDIADGVNDISGAVGDLVGGVVDPHSVLGQVLQTSFNNFVGTFVTTGSLGQAANAVFSSLESSVVQGLVNTSFVQDTMSFLNDAVAQGADTLANFPVYQDGLSLLEQVASAGLSGSAFGQGAASFLVNAVDGLAGQPALLQSSLSFLNQVVSDGLGDLPFAQQAVSLMNQAVTNGVNANLANGLVSFLDETAADGLTNSSFVENGLSFLNGTLSDGLNGSNLVQSGVSFLQNAVANGLSGSNVAQDVSTFLQRAGEDGSSFLNSTLVTGASAFLQQATQDGLSFLNSNGAGEVATLLDEAGQAGSTFANSTLGVDAGEFLQQVAQDSANVLNSKLVTGASAFLQQAAQDGAPFLNSSFAQGVGSFLDQAVLAGTGFANSVFADETSTLLEQSAAAGANFANSAFAQDAASFLDQALAGSLTGATLAQDALSYVNQTISNGAVGSNFAQDALPFLDQAVSAGFSGSNFAQDVGSFVSQLSSNGLTDAQDQLPGVNVTNAVLLTALGNACISAGYASEGTSALQLAAQLDNSPDSASVAQSIVLVSTANVGNGGTATVTLIARDAGGNLETSGGLTVVFGLGSGGSSGTFSTVTDNGNGTYTATFTGTMISTAQTITATINGSAVTSALPTIMVNPSPVLNVPTGASVNENNSLSFSGGNAISVTDAAFAGNDGDQLTLSVTNGTLTLVPTSGSQVSGSGTSSLTISGTLSEVNADLLDLVYAPNPGFAGSDAMTITILDTTDQSQGKPAQLSIRVNPLVALYGNLADYPGSFDVRTSQDDGSNTFPEYSSFQIAQGTLVDALSWQGTYVSSNLAANPPSPDTSSFTIDFYTSAGGVPGALLDSETIGVGSGGVQETFNSDYSNFFVGTSSSPTTAAIYNYNVTLPTSVELSADTQYFVSIVANTTNPVGSPYWGWNSGGANGPTYGNGSNSPTSQLSRAFTVVGWELAPVIAGPSSANVTEGGALAFTGANSLSVTDTAAAGNVTETLSLTVGHGTLNVANRTGLTVSGSGTIASPLLLSGNVSNLNADLSSLVYTPVSGFYGADTLSLSDTDTTDTFTGLATFALSVNPLPPTAANHAYGVTENQTLAVSASQGVLTNDSDPNNLAITAVVASGPSHGTLTLDANGDGGFTYIPNAQFYGTDSFTYQATDGVATSAPATVAIAVNPLPVLKAPASGSVNENSSLPFSGGNGISVSDTAGAGNDSEQLVLSVNNGTLTLVPTAGSQVTGSGTTSLTISGALSEVDADLLDLVFTPTSGYNGSATLSLSILDTTDDAQGAASQVPITINPLPVLNAPVSARVNENGSLPFSGGDEISVTDKAGSGNNGEQLTLSVNNGKLTLVPTAGSQVTGSGTASLTMNGTRSEVDTDLLDLVFTPTPSYSGSTTLSLSILDTTDGAKGAAAQVPITVNPLPVLNAPVSASVNENSPLTFSAANGSAITLTDAAASGSSDSLTLTAVKGTVTLASTSGLSFSAGTNGSASMTVVGTLANLNAAINGLKFTPTSGYSGAASLSMALKDSGDSLTASATITISVKPAVNGPSTVSLKQNGSLTFSSANGNAITLTDGTATGSSDTLSLTVTHGTLTLGSTKGLTFTARSNGSASMTVNGTLANLSSALSGLKFTPTSGYSGTASMVVTLKDAGDGLTTSATTAISVDPTISAPSTASVKKNATLTFSSSNSITLTDGAATGTADSITLTVAHGTLTLSSTTGLSFLAGANGSASMTIVGTLANLNAALKGLTYKPATNYSGSDSLVIALEDTLDNLTASVIVAISV